MKYKYDVFISYSRRDYVDESYNVIPGNAIAEIQNVFDENGITYWFDKDGIYSGQEFIEIITGAIAESKMLIFISCTFLIDSVFLYYTKFSTGAQRLFRIPFFVKNFC